MSEAEFWLQICRARGHMDSLTDNQWCRAVLADAATTTRYPGVNARIWEFPDGSSIADTKSYTRVINQVKA